MNYNLMKKIQKARNIIQIYPNKNDKFKHRPISTGTILSELAKVNYRIVSVVFIRDFYS